MILQLLLYILVLSTTQSNSTTDPFSVTCNFEEQEGFLKYVCNTESTSYTKCPYSEEYYNFKQRPPRFNITCTNDAHFYQACDNRIYGIITNSRLLCGKYLCQWNWNGQSVSVHSIILGRENLICNGKKDCSNTDLDEANCTKEKFTLPSGREVPRDEICDGKCDDVCEDEAICNGFTYGLYCKVDPTNYIHPYQICNGKNNCDDGEDEANCDVLNDTDSVCNHSMTSKLVPVHNYTRCARFPGGKKNNKFYCNDVIQSQSNCSDPTKVELSCQVNGYTSNVSKYIICGGQEQSACDDGIDKLCLSPSYSCKNIHKHYFCDGNNDCKDKYDETQAFCNKTVGRDLRKKGRKCR
ncbi:low-density lipoprotein receptor-related protein 2-like [Bolinopsis microptera]|uniref:low-density lipoprotein receptor-related protein 2-like n=1 Tax=Bolinopsis microptera TaxID=2820187 RepID=UPI003078DFD0